MKKINIIQLIASICLLIGSIINLLNLVIEIPFGLYVCTGPLLLISVVLFAVVIVKQIKKKNGKKQSYIIPLSSNPVSKTAKISFLQPLHNEKDTKRCPFFVGCNEAHLRCMKNEAGLRPMKRAFGSRRGSCALHFMATKLPLHTSEASASYRRKPLLH